MPLRRFKPGYFLLEGMNSLAVIYYFYYFYFFMQKEFGFGNRANLTLAALNGATYTVFAWLAGKFAQRFGCFPALKLGFGVMIAALAVGSQLTSAPGHVVVMLVTVMGMCFTWPVFEALISEGEDMAGLARMVGIYNMTWAATAAVANFVGGALLQNLGMKSLFYIPIGIVLCQLALTFWLESKAQVVLERHRAAQAAGPPLKPLAIEEKPRSLAKARMFLNMAWLANPFAYVAINTLVAAVPGVARRLALSTMLAGFCCSIWCFSRFAAFVVLWRWTGWHYRFRWLLVCYVALVGSFSAILLAPNVTVLVLAQILFGIVAGLIYYSSLFYSMDVGETKSEHGGFHEAAIGVGNFAGPAVGAASLYFLPQFANSGALAVSGLLLLGLAGLLAIWCRGHATAADKGARASLPAA
jgi:MFS family permease